MPKFEAVVLGIGGVGSATLAELARRGVRVAGIDRAMPPHDLGSSHGHTRLIRHAYFEHPDYVPLLTRAFALWRDLEEISQASLLLQTGVLQIGPEDGKVLAGIRAAAELHELEIATLDAAEIERRWPAFRVPVGCAGILESCAGILRAECCVAEHLRLAKNCGAEILAPCTVESFDPGPPVVLSTSAGEVRADRLIVTAGSWAGSLLEDLSVPLEVLRKGVFWFESQRDFSYHDYPGFLFELPAGVFYGFPSVDGKGVKIAEHSGGQLVADPLQVDRAIDLDDEHRVRDFLAECLPELMGPLLEHQVCLYTMTPDHHFVVDRHPQYENVTFAAGLSGHGFKFAPVLAQALADLALEGDTDLPIDFLSLRRFKGQR